MKLLEWKILYADGSTFSNIDGEPREAPRCGVQAVFYADDLVGVMVETSHDGYWAWVGEWQGLDLAGFWDHLFHHPSPLVVFGRYLKDSDWEGRIRALIEDEMDRPKSAWRKRERRA